MAALSASTTCPGSICGGGDDAVGVGGQGGVGEGVLGQRQGTLGAGDAAPRLLGDGLLAVEGGGRWTSLGLSG